MSIPIYLARYPSGSLFNDHWALFIPDRTRPSPTWGTLLQVEGDPLNGFIHDVPRNCEATQEYYGRHQPVLIELGTASEQHLEGDVGAVKGMENLEPRSDVEHLALSTEPPSKSMRSAGNGNEGTARKRIEIPDRGSRLPVVGQRGREEVGYRESIDARGYEHLGASACPLRGDLSSRKRGNLSR